LRAMSRRSSGVLVYEGVSAASPVAIKACDAVLAGVECLVRVTGADGVTRAFLVALYIQACTVIAFVIYTA
jgi:hypothetical protein